MPLPLVGAHAVLEGVPQFNRDADSVNSKVGQIHQTFGGLGSVAQKAGDLVASGFKTMLVAGAGAVTGIGAVGGAILKLGYDAANLPGIENVFKNMTASMSVDADALMEKMRQASYGAVKDFDLMKQANKAMVGAGKEFGKMFAESLPTLMQVSREAAKAQGLSVEYMYDSIVTGIKRMSPMILDNLGFQIQLSEAQDKYAASVGKTSAELTKEEKQMALLNEVTRLGTQLIEESGGHVDSVQKDVIAWGTALANVKDRIGIELVPVLQKFMDIVGKPGQGMQDAIVNVARGFVQWLLPAIDKVVQAISVLINGPLAMLLKGLSNIGLGGLKTLGESLSGILSGGQINFFDLRNTVSKALEPLLGKDMAEEIGKRAVDIAAALRDGLGPIRQWINDNIVPAFQSISGVVQGISDTLAGGDFPWEDVLPPGLADMAYRIVDGINYLSAAISGVGLGGILQFGPIELLLQAFSVDLPDGVDTFVKAVDSGIATVAGSFSQFFADLSKGGDFSGLATAISSLLDNLFGAGTGEEVMGFIGSIAAAFAENLPMIMDIISQLSILATNAFNTILVVAETVWPYIQQIIVTAWEVISAVFTVYYTQVMPVLLAAFDTILQWVNANWPAIQNIIVTVLTVIGEVVTAIVGAVGPFIIETFQGIADWTTENWPYIQETIVVVLNAILSAIQSVMGFIAEFWAANGDTIMEVVNTTWETIKTIVSAAIAIVQDIIMVVMALIRGDWDTVWRSIADILKQIWEVIKSIVRLALVVIKDGLKLAWEAIKVDIQVYWDLFRSIINAAWEAIKSLVGLALEAIKKLMLDEFGKIKTGWEDLWKGLSDIVTNVWDGIKSTVENAINDVIRLINRFIRAANRALSHVPGATQIDELDEVHLAQGGILNRPVFVAGEAGAEVVAPLADLVSMIKASVADVAAELSYRVAMPYSGPQPYALQGAGNTYVQEYNLTTQSVNRPNTLAMEFRAMEMSHL